MHVVRVWWKADAHCLHSDFQQQIGCKWNSSSLVLFARWQHQQSSMADKSGCCRSCAEDPGDKVTLPVN